MRGGKPSAMSYVTSVAAKYRKDFANIVAEAAKEQGVFFERDKSQHFYIDGVFYLPRKNMDCSNYWKVLLDAITDTQLVWVDDNVVCERVKRIYYDTVNPRVELEIYPVDYIGVFNNASHLEKYKSKCIDCSRYERYGENCSILKRAIEGRIQEDSDGITCKKFKEKKEKV